MIDRIDELTASFTHGVAMWVQAARATFAEALQREDAFQLRSHTAFAETLRSVRVYHSGLIAPHEGGDLREAVHELVDAAQADAGVALPDEELVRVLALGHDLVDEALENVRIALHAGHLSLTRAFRRLQVQASLLVNQGVKPRIAMNMVKVGAVNAVRMVTVDSIGRQWGTEVMCRAVVRQALMDTYNHAFMTCLVVGGSDVASIEHSGGKTEFSITGRTPGLPTLSDVEEHLHPNARFLVSRP